MITLTQFEAIKQKHGQYASWAVWSPADTRPKSNVGDMRALDPESNPALLSTLNPAVVMVGLNISRPVTEPLRNFHDSSSRAMDYKIRFACTGTRFYGAYMTDVLKFFVEVDSSKVVPVVLKRPEILHKSAELLREELRDLDSEKPEIVAFGKDAATLLRRVLRREEYAQIIPVTHYSHFLSKEQYRKEILALDGHLP